MVDNIRKQWTDGYGGEYWEAMYGDLETFDELAGLEVLDTEYWHTQWDGFRDWSMGGGHNISPESQCNACSKDTNSNNDHIPDYVSINFSVGYLLEDVPFGLLIDENGRVYFYFGFSVGPALPVGFSSTSGSVHNLSGERLTLSPDELSNVLTGLSVSSGGGVFIGTTRGAPLSQILNGSLDINTKEVGVFLPEYGGQVTYTIRLW